MLESKHKVVGDQPEVFGPFLVRQLGSHSWHPGDTVLALVDENSCLACIGFADYNTKAVQVHVWVGAPLPSAARELFCYAFYYALVECGVNWILGTCYGNEAAVEFDRKLGFEILARVPDAHPGGDVVLVGMHKDSQQAKRWLERGKRYEWANQLK